MLVVLSWLVFWIPQDAVPARIALGSTTVLSVVTFTGSFRSTFPKVCWSISLQSLSKIVLYVYMYIAKKKRRKLKASFTALDEVSALDASAVDE